MPLKLPKYILFLGCILFLAGCSATKLFYGYGDSIISWQLDSYFELTNEQEDWVEEQIRLHLEWHRKEELPRYKNFLNDIQKNFSECSIGSYPYFNFIAKKGGVNIVVSSWTMQSLDDVVLEIQKMIRLKGGKSSIV